MLRPGRFGSIKALLLRLWIGPLRRSFVVSTRQHRDVRTRNAPLRRGDRRGHRCSRGRVRRRGDGRIHGGHGRFDDSRWRRLGTPGLLTEIDSGRELTLRFGFSRRLGRGGDCLSLRLLRRVRRRGRSRCRPAAKRLLDRCRRRRLRGRRARRSSGHANRSNLDDAQVGRLQPPLSPTEVEAGNAHCLAAESQAQHQRMHQQGDQQHQCPSPQLAAAALLQRRAKSFRPTGRRRHRGRRPGVARVGGTQAPSVIAAGAPRPARRIAPAAGTDEVRAGSLAIRSSTTATGLPSRCALWESPSRRPGGLTGLPSHCALGNSPLGRSGKRQAQLLALAPA